MAGEVAVNTPFDTYMVTAGSNGSLVLPMVDTTTSGMPSLKIGPYFAKNPLHLSIVMPEREEAYNLPAPLKADRRSVRFQPVLLYLDMPLMPQTSFHFDRVSSMDERGKVHKTPAHMWEPHERTAIYPSLPVQMAPVLPGERVHFDGWSFFVRKKKGTLKPGSRVVSPFDANFDPPEMSRYVNVRILCLVEMTWSTMERPGKRRIQVVQGDPVVWSTGQAPEPIVPDMAPKMPTVYQAPDEEDAKKNTGLKEPRRPWFQLDDEEDESR